MKTIPVSLILACLLTADFSLAQADGPHPGPGPCAGGGKPGPPRPFWDAWKTADANHDGKISKEEFDTMPRIQNLPEEKRLRLFNRLDKDQNGMLDREEIVRIGKAHEGQGPPLQRLWELDVDHSGGISFEEFKAGQMIQKLPPARQSELFRRLDTDRDGLITPKDKPEPPFRRDGGPPHLKHPDKGKPQGPPPDGPPPPEGPPPDGPPPDGVRPVL